MHETSNLLHDSFANFDTLIGILPSQRKITSIGLNLDGPTTSEASHTQPPRSPSPSATTSTTATTNKQLRVAITQLDADGSNFESNLNQ